MEPITRRQLLTARQQPSCHHVSSAVVLAPPEKLASLIIEIGSMPGVEVHASKGSRIVITIEGPTSGALGETLVRISLLDGVIAANMVFEHSDDNLEDRA